MSSPVAGIVALLMFLAGVILLVVRRRPSSLQPPISNLQSSISNLQSSIFNLQSSICPRPPPPARRHLGLLLLLPFAVVAGAALAGVSPYGGTRHSSVLVAFAVAGVSYALARISAGRLVPILLAGIVLIPVWRITTHPAASWYIEPRNRRRELMTAAIAYIRQIVPPGRFIFTDIQTEVLLWRYLGEDYPVVRPSIWSFTPGDFGDNFFRMTEANGLRIGDSVFVASAGWGENLVQGLARRQVNYPKLHQFGDNIAVFVVPVGMESRSETLALRVKRTAQVLDSSALSLRAPSGAAIRTVLWPSRYLTDRTASLTLHLAPRVKPYGEVYQAVRQGERAFDRYLPALAFWDLGTHEAHPEFMSYMKDGENYVAGDYRFTLLAADSDSLTAVYRIERPTP
jgi:hypothetical protein